MEIEKLLQKSTWKRRVNNGVAQAGVSLVSNNAKPAEGDRGLFKELTQTDFMNELDPNAHQIYSKSYRSLRPKFKFNEKTGKHEVSGYDDVARVAVGIQHSIKGKKVSFTSGAGIWLGNEGIAADAPKLEVLRSYWALGSLNKGFMQFCESAFGTGDAAWYAYINEGEIDFKVFGFDRGDTCISALDDEGKDVFIRMFTYNNKKAVEIYDSKNIQLWVRKDKEGEKIQSEDGYCLVREHQHGLTKCPVVYHREPDVCWGVGQKTIERIEDIMSDLAENGKYYSFQILFLSGGVMSLPDSGFQGKAIASKSDKGKAEILAPADASNTFSIDLEKNLSFLWEVTDTVIVTPETLKGSNDSGAYLRTLYFKEIQWAMRAHSRMHPALKKFVSIFKELVGILEEDTLGYYKMKLSYEAVPFIPSNELEETAIVTQQVYAGVLSRETAAGELDRGASDEYARIVKESEMAEQEKSNPFEPKIDNKAGAKEDLIIS